MDWSEMATVLLLGGAAGILSGMFGIGGGLVIVPMLIIIFKFDPKTAIGTSLFALLLPTGLLGALEYWRRGELRMLHGALIALGLFCGAYVGARVTGLMSAAMMKRAYGVFLVIVAVYFFWSSMPDQNKPPRTIGTAPGSPDSATSGSQPVH
jgi:uncharacterized membrane protein YfcA